MLWLSLCIKYLKKNTICIQCNEKGKRKEAWKGNAPDSKTTLYSYQEIIFFMYELGLWIQILSRRKKKFKFTKANSESEQRSGKQKSNIVKEQMMLPAILCYSIDIIIRVAAISRYPWIFDSYCRWQVEAGIVPEEKNDNAAPWSSQELSFTSAGSQLLKIQGKPVVLGSLYRLSIMLLFSNFWWRGSRNKVGEKWRVKFLIIVFVFRVVSVLSQLLLDGRFLVFLLFSFMDGNATAQHTPILSLYIHSRQCVQTTNMRFLSFFFHDAFVLNDNSNGAKDHFGIVPGPLDERAG